MPRYQALIQKHVQSEIDITSRFCAGASAGATATSMTYPLDLMRARMAAHWAAAPKYAEGYQQAFKYGCAWLYFRMRVFAPVRVCVRVRVYPSSPQWWH